MSKKNRLGFTLVEILMVVALVGILSVASVAAIQGVSDDIAFDKTYQRMTAIKSALIGDLDTNKQGIREYYGYLGDVGTLPSSVQGLDALINQPAGVSAWEINATSKTGMGWRGPYLRSAPGTDWLKDSWGRSFVYNGTGTPYILSYGSDGVVGGTGTASDIQIDLTSNLTTATVTGALNKNSVLYTSTAVVELYQPDGNGALQTQTITLSESDNGAFRFSNVPFGLRSLKVFMPNATNPTATIGPTLISIDNSSYEIPHNYLDATPGAMPHTCAGIENWDRVSGSVMESTTTNRVYFAINVTQSMVLNSIFISLPTAAKFKGLRIGNETKNCVSDFECLVRCGSSVCEDTATDPVQFPEINLKSPWLVKAGTNIGAWIEVDDATGIGSFDIRLACKLQRI